MGTFLTAINCQLPPIIDVINSNKNSTHAFFYKSNASWLKVKLGRFYKCELYKFYYTKIDKTST